MAPNIARTTETSPLLPKPASNDTTQIDSSNDVAPEAADFHTNEEQDGGDIERQISNGDSSKHQGLPEVKKRMKYIFPAIAIGVSRTSEIGELSSNNFHRYSYHPPTRPS